MANRFYTLLIIPEKTSNVRRYIVPGWLLKGAAVAGVFISGLAVIMLLDYWFVLSQIGENKDLKIENRRLKQQVQVFKNKMNTIESTLDRVKTFATRLKVITNIEDHGNLVQMLNQPLPEAASNIDAKPEQPAPADEIKVAEASTAKPDESAYTQEFEELDTRFSSLSRDSLVIEQVLQDEYELLADQKAFLSALPTRKPTIGYFTSGFGVRKSPFGGREKMHEGLDIANNPGTPIRATADGVVLWADAKPGYGQTVILDHGYGLETWYGHNRKVLVSKGQKIHRGDQIALLGNSGRSTGPHCHYEVRVHGTPVDPLSYILEN